MQEESKGKDRDCSGIRCQGSHTLPVVTTGIPEEEDREITDQPPAELSWCSRNRLGSVHGTISTVRKQVLRPARHTETRTSVSCLSQTCHPAGPCLEPISLSSSWLDFSNSEGKFCPCPNLRENN